MWLGRNGRCVGKAQCLYAVVILGEVYATCSLPKGHDPRLRHRLASADGHHVQARYWCAHCGRPCGNFEGGHAMLQSGQRVCHPNVSGRPDCYRLITVYHEVVGVRQNETQTGFRETKATQGKLQGTLLHEIP